MKYSNKKQDKLENKKFKAILFIILCTFFTSIGQIFWKKGADNIVFNLELLINLNLILGFIFYGLGLVLLIKALKYGDLSFVYPFISLSFIWVGILSFFILNEPITISKWIAILVIVSGVSLIGYGGNK